MTMPSRASNAACGLIFGRPAVARSYSTDRRFTIARHLGSGSARLLHERMPVHMTHDGSAKPERRAASLARASMRRLRVFSTLPVI
jgi:hypothetical protein